MKEWGKKAVIRVIEVSGGSTGGSAEAVRGDGGVTRGKARADFLSEGGKQVQTGWHIEIGVMDKDCASCALKDVERSRQVTAVITAKARSRRR